MTKTDLSAVLLGAMLSGFATSGMAASYIFAGEGNGLDLVAHPSGYTGAGGNLTVTVGIDQTSSFAAQMAVSVQNVVNTFNAMVPTVNNFSFGTIASNEIDFESVLLHEMGHSLGLAHSNLASESGFPQGSANREAAKSTDGADNTFNVDAGADGVTGSADDIRGDDQNLVYFRIGTNDPFSTSLGVVDSTTYSRDVADLPTGDLYPNIATREVAALLGYGNTEAVMVQGSTFGEVQRSLGAQDVVGLMYAQSGLDSLAGTSDDYTLTLQFVGETTAADILIDFDDSETGFAVSQSSGAFLSANDVAITSNNIYFNDGYNWVFNQESNSPQPVPLPASGLGLLAGLVGFGAIKRRKRVQMSGKTAA